MWAASQGPSRAFWGCRAFWGFTGFPDPWDTGQPLGTFVAVTTGKEWMEAKDTAAYPSVHGIEGGISKGGPLPGSSPNT